PGRLAMRTRLSAVAAVIAVLLAACGGSPSTQPSASTGPNADIKVGLAISLTGAANIYGPSQQNGAKLAMDQINAAGGGDGAKIALVVEDGASAGEQGTNAFRTLTTADKGAGAGGDMFKKAAADNGITIARSIPYKTADVDFSAFVTQAKGESPDAILASGLAGTASKVLVEVGKQFPQGLRVVGSNGFNSPAVITAAGAAAPNMIVGTAWNKASTDKTNADFVKAFKDKYGSDPDQFATQAYTAMIVL